MPKITVVLNLFGSGIEVGVLGVAPVDILIIGYDQTEFEESKGTAGLDTLTPDPLTGWLKSEGSVLRLAADKVLLPDDVKAELGL